MLKDDAAVERPDMTFHCTDSKLRRLTEVIPIDGHPAPMNSPCESTACDGLSPCESIGGSLGAETAVPSPCSRCSPASQTDCRKTQPVCITPTPLEKSVVAFATISEAATPVVIRRKAQNTLPLRRGRKSMPQNRGTSYSSLVPCEVAWQNFCYGLPFAAAKESDGYVITTSVPVNFGPESVHAELSKDGSILTVSGTRLPTDEEAKLMQRRLAMRLHRVAQNYPAGRLQQLSDRLAGEAPEAFREMGHGKFVRFIERVYVPSDVDPKGMQAYISNENLHIRLPRLIS